MVSDEKMTHMVHLIVEGLRKEQFVDYTDPELAMREAKRASLAWLKQLTTVTDTAEQRIRSQKKPPMEGSPQWDNLFAKYVEEELKKKGG